MGLDALKKHIRTVTHPVGEVCLSNGLVKSLDACDGARSQRNGQPAMKAGSGTGSKKPNPVEVRIEQITSRFNERGVELQAAKANTERPSTQAPASHSLRRRHGDDP